MPTLTEQQCDDIIRYLQTEAFKDNVLSGVFIDDMVDLLNDNGWAIPQASGRGKNLLGTSGNTQRYASLKSDKVTLAQADADSVALGFNNLIERDDYTRNIRVKGKATTGTQKTTKTTPAGVTPPCRNLSATFFDHNGMMATNIISIANTGSPDAGWIVSAKKVAKGINYTTEFPISVGASYITGDRGINQSLTGLSGSAPANVQTPVAVAPAVVAAAVAVVEEEEEPEVVVPEQVAPNPSAIPFTETLKPKQIKGYDAAKNEKRRLSISAYEERDKTKSGSYPYPLKTQPIYFVLTPSVDDSQLQIPKSFIDPDSSFEDGFVDGPAFNTPQGVLIAQEGKKVHFTTLVNGILNSDGIDLTNAIASFTLKWSQPGSSQKIELFEAKDKSGDVIFKVIDGEIIQIQSSFTQMSGDPALLLVPTPNIKIIGTVLQLIIGAQGGANLSLPETLQASATTLGYPDPSYNEGLLQIVEDELITNSAKILFYSTQTQPVATVDVYEQIMVDIDGSELPADTVLARIIGKVEDVVDNATTYIKVFLDFGYTGAKTTDLFSGVLPDDEETRLCALIFMGDNFDLDIDGVNSELGLLDNIDKMAALKSLLTSTPVPAIDSDGNNLGYSTVSDATLTFENNGLTKVIQIPNLNGELIGIDRNGDTVKGKVDSIQVHKGNAAAAYETQKQIRRSNRLSPIYNLKNPSATDQNATASVAFRIGRKYYVIGRRQGQAVLIEIDLNYQTEA